MKEKEEEVIQQSPDNTSSLPEGEEHNEEQTPQKQSPWWIKLLKWIGGTILGTIAVLLLLTALLYIPAVQNWIVSSTRSEVAKATGFNLEIGNIRVGFPVKLKLEKVLATSAETGDLVGEVDLLTADISILPLLRGGSLPISKVLLQKASVDLPLSNDSIHITGKIGTLSLNRLDVDLKTLSMDGDALLLHDADVRIDILLDTIPKPDSPDSTQMVITFNNAEVRNLSADLWLYPDTMQIAAYISKGDITNGEVNLRDSYYQADRITMEAGVTALGDEMELLPMPWVGKVDGRKVRYGGAYDTSGDIRSLYYSVGDGVVVGDASFVAEKDSTRLRVEDLDLRIDETRVKGYADLPFDGWIPDSIGRADFHLFGTLKLEEVKRFLGGLEGLPEEAYEVDIDAAGIMESDMKYAVSLKRDNVIDLSLKGTANDALSSRRKLTTTYNILAGEQLKPVIVHFLNKGKPGSVPTWDIPGGLEVKGSASYSAREVRTDIQLLNTNYGGSIIGNAFYRPDTKEYQADLRINELDLQSFLPTDTIGAASATINLEGRGTDIFSPRTHAILYLNVDSVSYKQHSLRNVMLLSQLRNNQFFAALNSDNEALKMTAQTDVFLRRDSVAGSINILVDTVVPSMLGVNIPILQAGKMELRSNILSDLKENHNFEGEIENFILTTDKGVIKPQENTYITAHTSNTQMSAKVSSGDLSLRFEAQNGLNDFTNRISKVIQEVQKSIADSIGQMNMAPWIEYYPNMEVSLEMGRQNLLRAYLDEHRLGAISTNIDLKTVQGEGMSGLGVITYLQVDTFRVDNIDLVLQQDSAFFTAMATVHKEQFRNQKAFDIILSLSSNVKRSEAYLNWKDAKQREFIQLGMELFNQSNGDLTFGFTPDPIVLAYNKFNVLEDDYVTLPASDRSKIKANVMLSTDRGAKITVNDVPDNRGHLLRANVTDLLLSQLDGIEFIPNLSGSLNLTADWLQLPDKRSEYIADAQVKDFFFNQKPIGTLQAKATAEDDNLGRALVANVLLNNQEVAIANGFAPKDKEASRFDLKIKDLPLDKANPFLPEKYAELSGLLFGELRNYDTNQDIKSAPTGKLNGQLMLKEAKLYMPFANETYRMDSKPILVVEDNVVMDKFDLIASNGKLTMDGSLSLGNQMPIDLRITGNDVLLLNSQQTRETMLFGRVNSDANLWLRGPLSAFTLTGNVSLKGDTDVTYQSQDGELQVRNGYQNLVEFTDFADTLFAKKKSVVDSLSLGGMDIRLAIHIDPAAQVKTIIASNRASIKGGGDFTLSMPPYGAMTFNGTYNIQEGDILLSFPPISRKFTIRPGSKVAWNGILMEPDIDVQATSMVRSNVTLPGEPARQVDFQVSVIAENSLDNLKLRFKTEAPQDLTMRNTLSGLSQEEQTRQSIMLLTTGHYFGSGGVANTRGFDVNSTLASVLASQLNSLAGEALDAEINLGVTDGTNAYGQGTNYSYSITKRFMNNRISIQMGGRMVTGAAAAGIRQSFIDNMSLDYQLDQAGTHYLRLFHNKNYENILDGEVIETGMGYVIRRKLNKLGELFKFSKPLGSDLTTPRAIWQIKPRQQQEAILKNDEDEKDEKE